MKDTLKKLKNNAENCAYCGVKLKKEQKTLDHLLPKCRGGGKVLSNLVVCCENCNNNRDKVDINTFLAGGDRNEFFERYLLAVDFKVDKKKYYSELIRERILKNRYTCTSTKRTLNQTRRNEERNVPYKLPDERVILITATQSKILDIFLSDKTRSDNKKIAEELNISRSELNRQISCINNLTGVLPLDKVLENGIKFNPFFEGIESVING